MRRSLAIALLHLRTTFKSKGAIMTMFGMPLLLTLIFGVLTQGGGGQSETKGAIYPIAVVDLDSSFASRTLAHLLETEENLKVQVVSEEEMNKLFADMKISAGVVIPAQFQQMLADYKSPEVKLVASPGGTDHLGVSPTVNRQLSRLAQDYQLAILAATDKGDAAVEAAYKQVAAERQNLSTTVKTEQVQRTVAVVSSNNTPASHASVGFTVTFVMMHVFMMSGVILQERKNGTWGRLLTTPNSRISIITGYLLSFFLTGMAQFTILVVATRLLFHISWGAWLPLFALGAATVLSASGMGLFLAGIVRSHEQQVSVGILFINATAMLGGAYWDLAFVSDTMRRIGYLTPQAWAIDGFKEVMLRGGTFGSIGLSLAVLMGITLVFMSAGILRIRYE